MKVLLYSDKLKSISKSGLGKSIKHQMKALEYAGIEYTLDKNDDYDIIHANTYFLESYTYIKSAKKKGKKVVYYAHSTMEDFKNSFILSNQIAPAFKKWLILCYNLGDIILTPTEYSKHVLESYGLIPKIYAISNGIEVDKFKKNNALGNEFRLKYNYSKQDKVVIGIGLYIERKGIVDFVELAKRYRQYNFIWFGYSPLSATSQAVRDAVNTKLDNLIFAGYVSSEEIIGAMSGGDLYLFPTYEETEGIPVIEACACGINTLIRDIKVFDGWLEDGVNVYKAKNLKEFGEKMEKILAGDLPSLTKNARLVAEARDLKIIGQKLKTVYEEVLK